MYTYCGNNPVNMIDPTGHFSEPLFNLAIGIFAVVAVVATVLTAGAALGPLTGLGLSIMGAGGTVLATSGASELIEESTGYNPMRDSVFGGSQQAFNTYTAIGEIELMGGFGLYNLGTVVDPMLDKSKSWPPNDGFEGTPTKQTLQPGTKVDRYGYPENGYFASPEGTPFNERSLPASYEATKPYSIYEVAEEIEVLAGTTAPWFGQQGGGTQYMFYEPIKNLINRGVLNKIA